MDDSISRQVISLPYLGAIALNISDAFRRRDVKVWAEDSPFFKGKMAIVAYVDNVGACTTIDNQWVSEANISALLVALIKEKMNG